MTKIVNDLLNINGFKIVQDNKYCSFCLDSILLANFIKILPTTKKIIDLGTGNAPIPIVLSSKVNKQVEIIGIELQKEVCNLALQSININKLNDKIKIYNMDIKNLLSKFDSDIFDIVICNPPYFKYKGSSIINNNKIKSIARHEMSIDIKDIINIGMKLLKNKGSFYMIFRTERFIELVTKLKEHNLEPKRIQFIYPKISNEPSLFLIEATKNGKSGLRILKPLIIHNKNGSYKKNIIKIFGGKK